MHAKRADGAVFDFSIKGTIFRGLVLVLKQDGKLTAVESKLSGPTLELVRALPTAGAWIEGVRVVELEEAMALVSSDKELFEVGRRSVAVELRAITRSVTEGVLRLFGASPASLLSRISMFDPVTARGVKNVWTPTGDKRGEMRVIYPTSKLLPDAMGAISAGMLVATLEVCRTKGSSVFNGFTNEARNEMRFTIEWE